MVTFIFVVLLLFIVPGPAVMLTITQTLREGRKAGILTGVGIATGDFIHTIASVLGFSAILMTSAFAFEMIKYLGAAYLLYLGLKAIVKKTEKVQKIDVRKNYSVMSFRQAVLIELLNPKTALFFLAFLPQFISQDGLPIEYQFLILGLTFVVMSILYTSLLAIIVSIIGENLFQKKNIFTGWQDKLVGAVYISLGLKLALESQK